MNVVFLELAIKRAKRHVHGVCGGFVGSETALDLAEAGKDVTIVEMLPGIDMQDEPLSQISITSRLAKANVTILTNSTVKEVKDNEVVYANQAGELHSVSVNTVVAATGLESDMDAAKPFDGCASKVIRIGDARQARKIYDCFHQAWLAIHELSF